MMCLLVLDAMVGDHRRRRKIQTQSVQDRVEAEEVEVAH
jgi:hypothetical protein